MNKKHIFIDSGINVGSKPSSPQVKKTGKLVGMCNCHCHCDLWNCFTDHQSECEHCNPYPQEELEHMGDVSWCECECHTQGSPQRNCKKCFVSPQEDCNCSKYCITFPCYCKCHGMENEDWETTAHQIAMDYAENCIMQMLEEEIIDLVKHTLHSQKQKIREEERQRIRNILEDFEKSLNNDGKILLSKYKKQFEKILPMLWEVLLEE